jgi:hypothetical protein
MISQKLEQWFGKNWRTSLSGYIAVAAAFVAFAPELFPDTQVWGKWVQKIAAFVALGGGISLARNTKDKQVSGKAPKEEPPQ